MPVPTPPSPVVRAAAVTQALHHLTAMGHPVDEVIRAGGFAPEDLADDTRMINLRQQVALYEACAQVSGDPLAGRGALRRDRLPWRG